MNLHLSVLSGNETPPSNYIFTNSSLNGMEKVNKFKKVIEFNKNTKLQTDNLIQPLYNGWDEKKIKDMLNYDVNLNTKHREFHSTSVHAQPRRTPSNDLAKCENSYGWQMPRKINLDTVDGKVLHNLASNLENKNTPVKGNIIPPSPSLKGGSRRQKFLWFEQLRNLSPWSNKCNKNDAENLKQNFHWNSKYFIVSSKKKLVNLVSPKKEKNNKKYVQKSQISYRDVGVQTPNSSVSDIPTNMSRQYPYFSSPKSPPGSYHSPIQSSHIHYPSSTQSQNTTLNETEPITKFDFTRTVHSPPKKAFRSSQRKLNFPFNCSFACEDDRQICVSTEDLNQQKTYRSFNLELDQDLSTSKINYILSNIRSKLEANDQQAMHTFLETVSIGHHDSIDDLCLESHHNKRIQEQFEVNKYTHPSGTGNDNYNDPIYSEIEDGNVCIVESPDKENHTGIQHFVSAYNPDILYAKVNKYNKLLLGKAEFNAKDIKPHVPLAKIMQDSIKSKKITTKVIPLPTLLEPSGGESTSYSLPLSSTLPLTHCQSLNNVSVMEHSSSSKKQRSLSKSDLSLNRGEIFIENLRKSHLVVKNENEAGNVQKLQTDNKIILNRSYVSILPSCTSDVLSPKSDQKSNNDDTVSSELPNHEEIDIFNNPTDARSSKTAGSNSPLNTNVPASPNNQSASKKQSFVTKNKSITSELGVNIEAINISNYLHNSCKQSEKLIIDHHNFSLSPSVNEEYKYVSEEKSKAKSVLKKYKISVNVFHKSFRRNKNLMKKGEKHLSTSFSSTLNNVIEASTIDSSMRSKLNLKALFSPNETTLSLAAARNNIMCQNQRTHFFIDDILLPVHTNVNQDIIFNNFYIITFECGGFIKSTQSAECVNGTAMFRDCGIEFVHSSNSELDSLEKASQIKCNIFLLQLRKLPTVSSKPTGNKIIEKALAQTSSINISRFRLCASFTLNAKDFAPYTCLQQESNDSHFICLRASSVCTLPLTNRINLTNFNKELRLKGRAELRVPKHIYNGFLNV